jgi:hypothetical protein
MWRRIRQTLLYFLVGFTISFVIYLFIRFDAGQVMFGIAIGAVVGVITAVTLLLLERRFPEDLG